MRVYVWLRTNQLVLILSFLLFWLPSPETSASSQAALLFGPALLTFSRHRSQSRYRHRGIPFRLAIPISRFDSRFGSRFD